MESFGEVVQEKKVRRRERQIRKSKGRLVFQTAVAILVSISASARRLAVLLHQFSLKGLVLAVLDGGRLFKILPLLVLTDNTFFFYQTLEALDCFFQILGIINCNMCHYTHLPSEPNRQYFAIMAESLKDVN
jgi:hypothetical protein